MKENIKQITNYLIQKGKEFLKNPSGKILPTNKCLSNEEKKACKLVEDINNYPHFFLLFCVVNRGISAEKAISIPYFFSKKINSIDFDSFLKLSFDDYKKIFNEINCRYKNIFAKATYKCINDIHLKYSDNAANIWNDKPSSVEAVKRFKEFWGIGQKISTMAVNILARQFGVEFKNLNGIDISVDVHIERIFKRTGIIKPIEYKNLSKNELKKLIISRAREIYPEYPGILDIEAWKIGKEICHEINPKCDYCPLKKYCSKINKPQIVEPNNNKSDVFEELENIKHYTKKVMFLFNSGYSKNKAWEILTQHMPNFKRSTFNTSWSALVASNGRTPLQSRVPLYRN